MLQENFQPTEVRKTAGFAELNENNMVTKVICVFIDDILNENGQENDEIGQEFCRKVTGTISRWIRTYRDGSIRRVQACEGCRYDEVNDMFIQPQPYPSWIFNKNTLEWDPPVSYPDDYHLHCPGAYIWDENNEIWIFNND